MIRSCGFTVSLKLLLILFTIIIGYINAQYYNPSGSMELHYNSQLTTSSNSQKDFYSSSFIKLFSLQYPMFIKHPDFIKINPYITFYDSDFKSDRYSGLENSSLQIIKDYSYFDYRITSSFFSRTPLALSPYISQRWSSSDESLFSEKDTVTYNRGIGWNLYIRKGLFSYLPYITLLYDFKESEQNGVKSGTSETINVLASKNLFNIVQASYGYRIWETEDFKYFYQNIGLSKLIEFSRKMELDLNADYLYKDEEEIENTYKGNAVYRLRPNRLFKHTVKYSLHINDFENYYSQSHNGGINNSFSQFLLGSSASDESLRLSASAGYNYQYHIREIQSNSISTTIQSASLGGNTVYQRPVSFFYVKPGYTFGSAYTVDSFSNNTLQHSHKVNLGADNRGNKDLYANPVIYYRISFVNRNQLSAQNQLYGYDHRLTSDYFEDLFLESPASYSRTINSDQSTVDHFNTSLAASYPFYKRMCSFTTRGGYNYQKTSWNDLSPVNQHLTASQKMDTLWRGLNSNIDIAGDKDLATKATDYYFDKITARLNLSYRIRQVYCHAAYNYSIQSKYQTHSMFAKVVRRF